MMNMSQKAEFLHRYEEEKDPQSSEIRLPQGNQMCQETRVSDLRKAPFWVKIQMTKLFAISSINYLMSKSEGSSPKALDMSIAQFKKRTTYLDFRVKVYDLYQHVAKTCPFCNSTKSRPDRSRVSGLRAEEFGDLIFLDHGSTQNWRQNL